MQNGHISSVPAVIDDLRRGRMIILVDDPDRENEGDLAMLAEHASPEAINFMACEGRGLICAPLADVDCERLALEPQVPRNTSPFGTGFTVSVDAIDAPGPAISAAARAHTIRRTADPGARREDFRRPGHVFPLRARDGGVLVRTGQTEGIVDLARLAGARPAGVICEILNPDGTMARMPELQRVAELHHLKICTIESLVAYRRRHELLIEPLELDIPMPTRFGEFRAHLFRSLIDQKEHIAFTIGMPSPVAGAASAVDAPVWVRVHSECLTGDVFHSLRCDCGAQRDRALEVLGRQRHGVFVYMRQEGRGIGLANKLRAYRLQDAGLDTVEANRKLGFADDSREYGTAAQILHYLGVRRMRLLTNNPRKLHGLGGYSLEIHEHLPLQVPANSANIRYLRTKRDKLGHLLGGLDVLEDRGDERAR